MRRQYLIELQYDATQWLQQREIQRVEYGISAPPHVLTDIKRLRKLLALIDEAFDHIQEIGFVGSCLEADIENLVAYYR